MGGKKKKTLANKLSKMTDEERARYLQHRADMEEEAKRRKEQLIATFMKKKIKKEEAFARLNMAKINQNWHQILRKIKCQDMKEEVGHMKEAIDRILNYKNRTISKLLEELEEAEEQYLNNFQTHTTHIDSIIDDQEMYIRKLQKEYEDDLQNLIKEATEERNTILTNANSDQKYLQTVIFGQNSVATKLFQQSYEHYMQQLYESECNNRDRLRQLRQSRARVEGALWRRASEAVRRHVRAADARRLHLAELRRLDAAAAAGVSSNEERIRREEKQIETLRNDYEYLQSKRKEQINNLQTDLKQLNADFLKVRKNLQVQLQCDEKKLRFLIATAQNTEGYLKKVLNKGIALRNLAETCAKFETEREKVTKWFPICDSEPIIDEEEIHSKEEAAAVVVEKTLLSLTDEEKLLQKQSLDSDISQQQPSTSKEESSIKLPVRPKTAQQSFELTDSSGKESDKVATIQDIALDVRKLLYSSDISRKSSSSGELSDSGILKECYESLAPLENFWLAYNKVEVGFIEIKEEKKILLEENKQLRGMIKTLLDAATAVQNTLPSKIPTRAISRCRNAYSAPVGKILFSKS